MREIMHLWKTGRERERVSERMREGSDSHGLLGWEMMSLNSMEQPSWMRTTLGYRWFGCPVITLSLVYILRLFRWISMSLTFFANVIKTFENMRHECSWGIVSKVVERHVLSTLVVFWGQTSVSPSTLW